MEFRVRDTESRMLKLVKASAHAQIHRAESTARLESAWSPNIVVDNSDMSGKRSK